MPDVHGLIEKLPHPTRGWTLPPSYKYCGPLNPLDVQLDGNDIPNPGHEPINALDEVCMWHDVKYRDAPHEKHRWDKEMIRKIDLLAPSSGWKESMARKLVKAVISGKVKLGLGMDERVGFCLHAPSREMGKLLKEMNVPKYTECT